MRCQLSQQIWTRKSNNYINTVTLNYSTAWEAEKTSPFPAISAFMFRSHLKGEYEARSRTWHKWEEHYWTTAVLHLCLQLLVLSAVWQGRGNRCTDSSAALLLGSSSLMSSTTHFQTLFRTDEDLPLPTNIQNYTLDDDKTSSDFTPAMFCSTTALLSLAKHT